MKNYETLKKEWLAEEQQGFKGWDFAHLDGRWEEQELPWRYEDWVKKYLKPEHKLLDMGTGGGEVLLSFDHPYFNTSVTEAWEPNVKLCKKRLKPLGICVKQIFDVNTLPFEDNTFDIVLNRHEGYEITELKRVLKPGGLFITQQVGGKNNAELSEFFINDFKSLYEGYDLTSQISQFKANGFEILYENECFPYLRFFDIGAVAFFARVIEWEFPGFSVEGCFEKLCLLHDKIVKEGFVESKVHRFVIVAHNNKLKLEKVLS